MALYTIEGSLIPVGYEQITGLSAVKPLTIPEDAELAVIAAEAQNVRWRDDGCARPSLTFGPSFDGWRAMRMRSLEECSSLGVALE